MAIIIKSAAEIAAMRRASAVVARDKHWHTLLGQTYWACRGNILVKRRW